MAGIYIHIPFCKQACHYCDFHFSTNLSRVSELVQCIELELALRKNELGSEKVTTVYFGGGTPSLLNSSQLESILSQVQNHFDCDWEEVTLEANPDDLHPPRLEEWKGLGIDRLSLGIQSFHPEILKFYNRSHSAEQAMKALEISRKAGFEKFSLDLIYGFPHSDHRLWKKDLQVALDMDPGHISAYSLTVEPKTALGNWAKKGKFTPANEDFVAEQLEWLQEETQKAGYVQYEISNFGKPEKWALHNSNYWRGIPYLGIGPSAHSFDGKTRGANLASNPRYIEALRSGKLVFQMEEETPGDRANELILTSLRTVWGLDLAAFEEKFGIWLWEEKKSEIKKFEQAGWMLKQGNTLSLTPSGMLLADSIAAELFL
ncbi:radical SAM family heme chaperone HemW [Algoriphagus confluentis]|uniref:Heme chaperone HemW n=1 Tax=Algoriphagus confluentis TaxID=1697556 RepID=A0ABQ6PIZ6_9BACT|nr:radical SAM family heme chaperone HemW [Algoriphagus confluentis]